MTKRTWLGCIIAVMAFGFVLAAQLQALEVQRLYPVDDGAISEIARAMRHDVSATVTILVYSQTWTIDTVDNLISKGMTTVKKLQARGIRLGRITLSMTDDSGFDITADNTRFIQAGIPKPDKPGVYIYLD